MAEKNIDALRALYKEYQQYRSTTITEDQFVSFAVFFPTLLVIISDGVVDMDEWEYVKQLSQFMANTFKDDNEGNINVKKLSKSYLEEISYMIKFQEDWRSDFINALRPYLKDRPEVKNTVLETIYLFAEASEGISEEEQEAIDDMKEKLQLK
ncbi:MAG: hypothetical protein LAT68_15090 [Cyclobacteriaceae bacterium]|nr:hypothetical protein [Cyclobacteriaceae bacterium]MCH8517646.1 hypothetical protein [Cyclobacteriaceae bacterium]